MSDLPTWVLSVQEYDQIRSVKVITVLLYAAIFVYPLDDNDNTYCGIWNQQSARDILTRPIRSAIWTMLVCSNCVHLWSTNIVQNELRFFTCFFLLCWISWDRTLSESFAWYRKLDRIRIPGVANFHELLSLAAFLAAAHMPMLVAREHTLDLWSAEQKSLGLTTLVIVYIISYAANPIAEDPASPNAERSYRIYWYLNVFEALIISLSVGAV